ncbi:MAG TPA: hypothetical protein VN282_03925 [Pyrinomonadaceae bacterium]|nr:hypothetical protein [Pyrinomonadaceae bacterium]
MKLKRVVSLVILAVALFAVAGWPGYAQKRDAGRAVWEYRALVNASEPDLNKLGAEGWEMVGFSIDQSQNRVFYFKRAR